MASAAASGAPFPKQFLLLGGKPLLIHVLEKARAIAEIEQVVITCPDDHLDETRELVANHGFGAPSSSASSAAPAARSRST